MYGKRLLIVIVGAVIGAIACVTVAKLLHLEKPGSLSMGMAGGIVGAFTGRAVARRQPATGRGN